VASFGVQATNYLTCSWGNIRLRRVARQRVSAEGGGLQQIEPPPFDRPPYIDESSLCFHMSSVAEHLSKQSILKGVSLVTRPPGRRGPEFKRGTTASLPLPGQCARARQAVAPRPERLGSSLQARNCSQNWRARLSIGMTMAAIRKFFTRHRKRMVPVWASCRATMMVFRAGNLFNFY
jgi:hypothetical protein